jgi:hypothetical protein
MNTRWEVPLEDCRLGVRYEDTWEMESAGTIRVVLVAPPEAHDAVRDLMLEGLCPTFLAVMDCKKLSSCSIPEPICLAVLHHRLSASELDDASRTIRRRWPRARILVIREGENFLDDALYDDQVAPPIVTGGLLATIRRVMNRQHD